jgi:hypothetical protein
MVYRKQIEDAKLLQDRLEWKLIGYQNPFIGRWSSVSPRLQRDLTSLIEYYIVHQFLYSTLRDILQDYLET